MINKIMTADEAVAGVKDGMTIMVGGFLATGSPEVLMDALVRKGVKHLTAVSYTHLRAHETGRNLVCRLLLEKKKK